MGEKCARVCVRERGEREEREEKEQVSIASVRKSAIIVSVGCSLSFSRHPFSVSLSSFSSVPGRRACPGGPR